MSSNRIADDLCYIDARTIRSTKPLSYIIDVNNIKNCSGCLDKNGEGPHGEIYFGDSTTGNGQWNNVIRDIDLESVMNKQLALDSSKCLRGEVIKLDMKHQPLVHEQTCNKNLDTQESLLTHPKWYYKELSTYPYQLEGHLFKPPQEPIFWSEQIDTRILAKDLHIPKYPKPLPINLHPMIDTVKHATCHFTCFAPSK